MRPIAWTRLSSPEGMPSGRRLPFAVGMSTRRTGLGRERPVWSGLLRVFTRAMDNPSHVVASLPGVVAPLCGASWAEACVHRAGYPTSRNRSLPFFPLGSVGPVRAPSYARDQAACASPRFRVGDWPLTRPPFPRAVGLSPALPRAVSPCPSDLWDRLRPS
jgi:hypothetical protein